MDENENPAKLQKLNDADNSESDNEPFLPTTEGFTSISDVKINNDLAPPEVIELDDSNGFHPKSESSQGLSETSENHTVILDNEETEAVVSNSQAYKTAGVLYVVGDIEGHLLDLEYQWTMYLNQKYELDADTVDNADVTFGFIGNLIDGGANNITIIRRVTEFLDKLPGSFLIAGNREINKLQLRYLLGCEGYYYTDKAGVKHPIDGLDMSIENDVLFRLPNWKEEWNRFLANTDEIYLFITEKNDAVNLSNGYLYSDGKIPEVRHLDLIVKTLFLFKHVLGAPKLLSSLSLELGLNYSETVKVFLEMLAPNEGELYKLIAKSKLMHVVGDTLFVHGFINEQNYLIVPQIGRAHV